VRVKLEDFMGVAAALNFYGSCISRDTKCSNSHVRKALGSLRLVLRYTISTHYSKALNLPLVSLGGYIQEVGLDGIVVASFF
jgi:hypothetical protein